MPPTLLPILQGAALLTEIAFGRGDSGNGKPRAADDEFKFAEQLSNALSASAQNSPAFAQIHREARVESRREIEERTARNDDFTKPRDDSRRLDDDRSAPDSRQSRRGEGPEGRDMTRVSEKTSSRHEGATTPKDISRQGRVGSHAATSHSAESSYVRSTEGAPYAQNHSTAAAQLHQGELQADVAAKLQSSQGAHEHLVDVAGRGRVAVESLQARGDAFPAEAAGPQNPAIEDLKIRHKEAVLRVATNAARDNAAQAASQGNIHSAPRSSAENSAGAKFVAPNGSNADQSGAVFGGGANQGLGQESGANLGGQTNGNASGGQAFAGKGAASLAEGLSGATSGNAGTFENTLSGLNGAKGLTGTTGLTTAAATSPTGHDISGRVSQAQQILAQSTTHLSALAQKGGGRMVISLSPEHLGRVRLEVQLNDSVASARLSTDNPQVRAVLQAEAANLRDALAQQGIQLGQFDVGDMAGGRSGQDAAQAQTSRQELNPLRAAARHAAPGSFDTPAFAPRASMHRGAVSVRI
ncbi:flagellar hook-length control protein FliK [bacterium]|nr:flagellar hook-length control protein FliK [bacterium]